VPLLNEIQFNLLNAFGPGDLESLQLQLQATPQPLADNTSVYYNAAVYAAAGGDKATAQSSQLALIFNYSTADLLTKFQALNLLSCCYTENNVSSFNFSTSSNPSFGRTLKNDIQTSLAARAQLIPAMSTLSSQCATALAQKTNTKTLGTVARDLLQDAQSNFQNVQKQAAAIVNLAYCGSIADSYLVFKNSFCVVTNTALAFVTLTVFMQLLLLLPAAGCAHCVKLHLLPQDPKDPKHEGRERKAVEMHGPAVHKPHEKYLSDKGSHSGDADADYGYGGYGREKAYSY